MLAALDLGGYSTQVTYPRPDLGSLPQDDIYPIVIPGYWTDSDVISPPQSTVRLYSKRYQSYRTENSHLKFVVAIFFYLLESDFNFQGCFHHSFTITRLSEIVVVFLENFYSASGFF